MKWITMFMMVTGLVLIVYSGSVYMHSGELAHTIPLNSTGESKGQVELFPEMSPVRVVLNTEFVSLTKSTAVRFYSYAVAVNGEEKNALMMKKGALTLRRESKDIPANELSHIRRRIHSLDAFSIQKQGLYDWSVLLTNHQAEITRSYLQIRRNVATELPRTLWFGLVLLLASILLGFYLTRKPGEV